MRETKCILQVSGLAYTYANSDKGIHDVRFCIDSGSFTVIAGRRGAGKTTLLHALLGLLPLHTGVIRWKSRIVRNSRSHFAPPRCAYILRAPQHPPSAPLAQRILVALPKSELGRVELLVLDDIADALDERTERAVWDQVFAGGVFQKSTTCLVVSNRRPALRRADQIVVLRCGKVESTGTLQDLLTTSEEMKGIWYDDSAGADSVVEQRNPQL